MKAAPERRGGDSRGAPLAHRYDSDPAIVGRVVRINGAPVPVVGVMPDGMRFPQCRRLAAAGRAGRARSAQLSVYGRLADYATTPTPSRPSPRC
jgi:hypothetical protein